MNSIKNKTISIAKEQYYGIYEKNRLEFERWLNSQKLKNTSYNPKPKIFVYIPTYNRSKILMERAVDSVLSQSYKNIHILVVGDGCSDDTEARLAKIKDPRLNFINLSPRRKRGWPNQPIYHWMMGATIPANFALKNAVGDYSSRIDDDDVWLNTHIEESLDFLRTNNYEFISSYQECRGMDEVRIEETHTANEEYYTQKPTPSLNPGPRIGGMSSYLYVNYISFIRFNQDSWRKSWCKTNDIDYTQRLYKAGVRMGFLEKVLSFSQPRPGRANIGSSAISERGQGDLY